jgi:nicotinate-nucleotide adenylyltransferase
MRIGIYGGTFNPPHTGHRKAAQEAIRALKLDKLLIIPTAEPPHKELPGVTAAAKQRLELARLCFGDVAGAEISDMELRRGGKSYTIDTVSELRRQWPEAELWLVMGGDMFLTVDRWYRADELLREAGVAVSARAGEREDILHKAEALEARGARVRFIDTPPIVISSTALRESLREAGGREYLTEAVYAFVVKNRLYGARAELGWLREQAKKLLDPKRVPHVLGVEQEAVRLAERWGAEVYDAAAAGILHDITKRCSDREQLQLCVKYGTVIDELERQIPKLLHAKTGADLAWHEFGVSPEIREAIRWHTTGRENMSLLEKIVYLADYIEPNRSFEGLDRLRALAYEDLDEALRLGLQMSLDEMKERRIVPHPNSLRALQSIETELKERNRLDPYAGIGAI